MISWKRATLSTFALTNLSRHFWVDDFPNFPFGGITCDSSLEGCQDWKGGYFKGVFVEQLWLWRLPALDNPGCSVATRWRWSSSWNGRKEARYCARGRVKWCQVSPSLPETNNSWTHENWWLRNDFPKWKPLVSRGLLFRVVGSIQYSGCQFWHKS